MKHMLFALAGVGLAGFAFAQQAPIHDWLRRQARAKAAQHGVLLGVSSRNGKNRTLRGHVLARERSQEDRSLYFRNARQSAMS